MLMLDKGKCDEIGWTEDKLRTGRGWMRSQRTGKRNDTVPIFDRREKKKKASEELEVT